MIFLISFQSLYHTLFTFNLLLLNHLKLTITIMKGLIIFKGKYGATSQYAEWLSHSLALPAVNPEHTPSEQLRKSDFLILGSSIYVGKLVIKAWLKKHAEEIMNKKLFFFIVCGTPASEKEKLEQYIQDNIPEPVKKTAEIFFLPGHLIVNELSWLDKLFLNLGAIAAKTPEVKKRMLTDYNNIKEEHLSELMNAVSKYSGKAELV